MTRAEQEKGFSLIELLCVMVIIGIVTTIAVPALRKAIRGTENGAVLSAMRTISSTQANFYSTHARFGTLDEINSELNRGIGSSIGVNQTVRFNFTFENVPGTPTNTELKDGYIITATRNPTGDTNIYKYQIDQTGYITQLLP